MTMVRRPSHRWRETLRRRPGLPLLTALSGLAFVAVLARPSALITFGLITLAGSLNSKRRSG